MSSVEPGSPPSAEAARAEVNVLAPGTIIRRRYELVKLLGQGSFASVWRARDLDSAGLVVALKILKAAVVKKRGARARFLMERAALLKLDHPSIVRLLHSKVYTRHPFMALELVEWPTLSEELFRRAKAKEHYRPLEVGELINHVTGGVAHAHAKGIVHRDLKPKNLGVEPSTRHVRIFDFGIARFSEQEAAFATTHGRMVGSLLFMAPEQLRSEKVDFRADVFALGCIAFELLTLRQCWTLDASGQPLLAGASVRAQEPNSMVHVLDRILSKDRPRPTLWRPELSPEVDAVIARALAVKPERRFASVDELNFELNQALAPKTMVARSQAAPAATEAVTVTRPPALPRPEAVTIARPTTPSLPQDPATVARPVTPTHRHVPMVAPRPRLHPPIDPEAGSQRLKQIFGLSGVAAGIAFSWLFFRSPSPSELGAEPATLLTLPDEPRVPTAVVRPLSPTPRPPAAAVAVPVPPPQADPERKSDPKKEPPKNPRAATSRQERPGSERASARATLAQSHQHPRLKSLAHRIALVEAAGSDARPSEVNAIVEELRELAESVDPKARGDIKRDAWNATASNDISGLRTALNRLAEALPAP